jgi:hypothetical protein
VGHRPGTPRFGGFAAEKSSMGCCGWRRIIRFWAKLVEARLDGVEAGRQTIKRTTDRGRNRIDLLTQVLELGIGPIMTL